MDSTTISMTSENNQKKGELSEEIKRFVEIQNFCLEKERQEEETQTLDKIFNYSARDLEKLGVCIRKLDLIETVYESYGKYLTQFQKRTKNDLGNKISRYKFDTGDVVGLCEFSETVHAVPLYKGIVSQFNEKKILVAFDNEIEAESLPKNICLVQLVNQVTYEKIQNGLEQLGRMQIPQSALNLVNTLFGINYPTLNTSESTVELISDLQFFNQSLNQSQKDAVSFCLQANELAIIHGPPGTGKTTTVVELILQSIKAGKKVLVVAPSNIAVDNIAEKLLQFKFQLPFDFCRIGHPARILPSIVDVSVDAKVEKSSNMKFVKDVKREIEKVRKELIRTDNKEKDKRSDLKKQLKGLRDDIKGSYRNTLVDIFLKCKVIFATCVGASDHYLQEALKKCDSGTFDTVIVDECAQATESLCWISILQGKKLILAGDHLQLPPTIKSKEAVPYLGFTLFDRMMKMYGKEFSKLLDTQYRMNEAIMNFSSMELYEGRLIADESVKSHKVIDLLLPVISSDEDIEKITSSDTLSILDKNLIIIDTSGLQFYEGIDIDSLSRYNGGEAILCKFFTDYLMKNSIHGESIGIITPYSAQVNTLHQSFTLDEYKDVEISTVDGFQGREKEIILLSLVRSNKKHEVGFLADNRRLNVAITRAKRMIILICDTSTVSMHPFLKKLCKYFEQYAYPIEITDNIMNYKEIQDIQYESSGIDKTEQKGDTTKEKKKKSDKKKKAKKAKNETENANEDIHIVASGGGNNKAQGNLKHGILIGTQPEMPSEPAGKEPGISTSNSNSIPASHKKETLDMAFIKGIKSLIQDFQNSKEEEYKIEGLSNVERKYIHCYAEMNNLIHESHGDNNDRVLILRKKNPKKKETPNKGKITEGVISPQSAGKEKSENSSTASIPIVPTKKSSGSKQNNIITIPSEEKVSDVQIPKQPQATTAIRTAPNQNIKVKVEVNWDEIDNLLADFRTQDTSKCHQDSCANLQGIVMCQFCKSYFCSTHIRGVIHNCVIYSKPESVNTVLKEKVSHKISSLEHQRNKKTQPKKKK